MNRFVSNLHRAAVLVSGLFLATAASAATQDTAEVSSLKLQLKEMDARLAAVEKSTGVGGGTLHLIDTSVDVLIAGGVSSEDNAVIEELQGGGHDPKRNGFTLQQAEVSFSGAIDPYFTGESHIVFLEDGVELEEAFLTSTALPAGLELKVGYFLTEFGRVNPTHPHTWYWMDQPIVASRLLGEDGVRAAGARLAWLLPTPWYSQLYAGIQNADSETAVSFLGEGHHHREEEAHAEEEESGEEHAEETIGGRPSIDRDADSLDELLYLLRWENSFDLTAQSTALFGLSALHGPNAASEDGETTLYGADLTLKWRPTDNRRGYPFVLWQTEVMKRDFKTGGTSIQEGDEFDVFQDETIEDWGLYSQVVWGFASRWETGLRIDYVTGNDAGVEERTDDPSRCDRVRISPMLAFRPSEFSRIRVQYNYDDADNLADPVHTVWAGMEFLYGKHPAHKF